MLYFSDQSYVIFFSKYHRAGVFNLSEIENKHDANFQNKMYIKFWKMENKKKKKRFGRIKIGKIK